MKLLLLLLLPTMTCGQLQKFESGGTLIIGTIAQDGILVAGDTRTSLGHGKDRTAYFDSTQKLFVVGSFVLALAGKASIDGIETRKIVEDFSKTNYGQGKDLIINFLLYCKNRFTNDGYANFILSTFILSAGYENRKPVIYTYSTTNKPPIIPIYQGFQISSGFSTTINDYLDMCGPRPTVSFLATNTDKFIQDFAKKNSLEDFIGGPIQLVTIKADGTISWIKNEHLPVRFNNILELRELINTNQLHVNYTRFGNYKKLKVELDSMATYYHKR